VSARTTPEAFQVAADAWYHALREQAEADAALRTVPRGDSTAWRRYRASGEAVATAYRAMRAAAGGAR
jgi:hypothetical protein